MTQAAILTRLSVEEARERMLAAVAPLGAETVDLDQALGRFLAAPVRAARDQPPFDRVSMDGIALDASAVKAGQRRFRIAGLQAAGDLGGATVQLGPGDDRFGTIHRDHSHPDRQREGSW